MSYVQAVVVFSFHTEILAIVVFVLEFSLFDLNHVFAMLLFVVAVFIACNSRSASELIMNIFLSESEVASVEENDEKQRKGRIGRGVTEESTHLEKGGGGSTHTLLRNPSKNHYYYVVEGEDSFYLRKRRCLSEHYKFCSIERYALRFYNINQEYDEEEQNLDEQEFVRAQLFNYIQECNEAPH